MYLFLSPLNNAHFLPSAAEGPTTDSPAAAPASLLRVQVGAVQGWPVCSGRRPVSGACWAGKQPGRDPDTSGQAEPLPQRRGKHQGSAAAQWVQARGERLVARVVMIFVALQ